MKTNKIKQYIKERKEYLRGISAQGYTTDRNAKKILDPELLEDIEKVYRRENKETINGLLDVIVEEIERMEKNDIQEYIANTEGAGVVDEIDEEKERAYNQAIEDIKQLLIK